MVYQVEYMEVAYSRSQELFVNRLEFAVYFNNLGSISPYRLVDALVNAIMENNSSISELF
jgi:glycine/D-amino acid oxidase-like deaminating enzyme